MKKLLLSMFCALGIMAANAATIEFDFTTADGIKALNSTVEIPTETSSGTNVNDVTFTKDGVSITGTAGSTEARIWLATAGYQYRLYKNGTITIACGNELITSITITSNANTAFGDSFPSGTWTGSSKSVTATIGANVQITKIVVVTGEGSGDDPVVTPPTGNGTTVTFNATEQGYTNQQEISEASVTPITFDFIQNGNTNGPKYYTANPASIRMYVKNQVTVSSDNNSDITSVVFGFGSGYGETDVLYFTASTGSYASGTWTGNAKEITFTVTSSGNSGHLRVQTITVTYAGGEEIKVLAPVVKCENNEVSMSCATADASIYYTLNGNTPDNNSMQYTAPFPINETVTVKAIAYVGSDASAVTTYTANYVGAYASFADYIAANPTAGGTVNGPITVVYQNGGNTYLKDSKGGYMLSYTTNSSAFKLPTLNNGDVLASISGTYSPYGGLPEMVPTAIGEVTTGGAAVEPDEIALEEMSVESLNAYVVVKNVNIGAPNGTSGAASRTYPINDGTNDDGRVVLYNTFYNATYYEVVNIPEGEGFTITGFTCINNGNLQITPISITDGTAIETVANPVFTPAGGAVAAGTLVEITCATEGATIFYTTDGTQPSITSTEYTEPIVVNEAMTISAIAIMEDKLDSDIVSASFTIMDPNATLADFNFEDEDWLTAQGVAVPTEASTGTDVAGKSFSSNAITLTFNDTSASNKARIWRNTANSGGGVQLRMYTTDGMSISAAEGFYLHEITFTSDAAANANLSLAEGSNGELTLTEATQTWTPSGDTCPASVALVPTKTTRILGISVVYSKDSSNGVNDIMVDSNNGTAEYYNLQGIRVANPTAGNLYIVRQGNKVSKVIVR